ncbi:MAG: cobalt transporter CbiM [Nitrospinota bacterium]
MHIAEGVLSTPLIVSGCLLSAAGVGIGLKKLEEKNIVKVAIFSSAFFVVSLLHIPLGVYSAHLTLNGLMGVILGWPVFCSVLIVLFLQTTLFQIGGLTALGVNTFNIAVPALVAFFCFKPFLKRDLLPCWLVGFLIGSLSTLLTLALLSLSLVTTSKDYYIVAKISVIANMPVIILEGVVTALLIQFIKKIKPEILDLCGK